MDLLHGHVLVQTSPHTRFADHQDTEENRKKRARKPTARSCARSCWALARRRHGGARPRPGAGGLRGGAGDGRGVQARSGTARSTRPRSTVKLTLFFGRWL